MSQEDLVLSRPWADIVYMMSMGMFIGVVVGLITSRDIYVAGIILGILVGILSTMFLVRTKTKLYAEEEL